MDDSSASQGLLSRGGEDNPLLKKDWSGDPLRMYSTYMLYVTKKKTILLYNLPLDSALDSLQYSCVLNYKRVHIPSAIPNPN